MVIEKKKSESQKNNEAGELTDLDKKTVAEKDKQYEEYLESQEKTAKEYDHYLIDEQTDQLENYTERYFSDVDEDIAESIDNLQVDDLDIFADMKTDNEIMKKIIDAKRELNTDERYRKLKEIRNTLDGLSESEQKRTINQQLTNMGAQRYFAEIESKYFNNWRDEFIIDTVLPRNGLTIIAGQSGGGKSWIAYEMMVSALLHEKFLNTFNVDNANVVYFDLENDASTSRKRLLKLTRFISEEKLAQLIKHGRLVNILYSQSLSIGDFEKHIKDIREAIDADNPRKNLVVFVDVLKRMFNFDENDASSTNDILTPLKQICQKYRVSIVLIHHTKKITDYKERFDLFSSMRGSSEIYNIADSVVGVVSEEHKETINEETNLKTITKDILFFQNKLRRGVNFGLLNLQMIESIDHYEDADLKLEDIRFDVIDPDQLGKVETNILSCLMSDCDKFFSLSELKTLLDEPSEKKIRIAIGNLIDKRKIMYDGKTKSRKYKISLQDGVQETLSE